MHPELFVGFRIKPLVAHSLRGDIDRRDRTTLPKCVINAPGDLIAPEIGGTHRHTTLGRYLRWLNSIEPQHRVDMEQIGLQPINLMAQLNDLPGDG